VVHDEDVAREVDAEAPGTVEKAWIEASTAERKEQVPDEDRRRGAHRDVERMGAVA